MASPKSIFLGAGNSGFRVEYVRGRGVLRIAGWQGTKRVVAPVEVLIADVVGELGIEAPAAGAFLMFGGIEISGGSRDCLGVFGDQASAKRAFTELRTSTIGGWAEVVHVVGNQLVQVCWFGQRNRGIRREPRRFLRRA